MKINNITSFIVIAVVCVLSSCSAPYSVTTNPRLISDWTVTSIQLEGDVAGEDIQTPVFDDANIGCLTSSRWSLTDGGGGSYLIKGDSASCTVGLRRISWEVVNLSKTAHYFQFFRAVAPKGVLADRFTTYIMEITSLTKSDMVLRYPVKYHDKTGSIVFTFTRGK